jgi:hypothetical protein
VEEADDCVRKLGHRAECNYVQLGAGRRRPIYAVEWVELGRLGSRTTTHDGDLDLYCDRGVGQVTVFINRLDFLS